MYTDVTIGVPVHIGPIDQNDCGAVLASESVFDIIRILQHLGAKTIALDTELDLELALSKCDGVVLPGGGDVNPELYGEVNDADVVHGVNKAQDAFDLAVLNHALETNKPIFGICRGMQLINVALGGTLHLHIEDEDTRHVTKNSPGADATVDDFAIVSPVEIARDTIQAQALGNQKVIEVRHIHHQAVDQLAPGLKATAHAPDLCIEGLQGTDPNQWIMAVQWHPELAPDEDPSRDPLFTIFLDNAKARKTAV